MFGKQLNLLTCSDVRQPELFGIKNEIPVVAGCDCRDLVGVVEATSGRSPSCIAYGPVSGGGEDGALRALRGLSAGE